jgi:hypothetical protein
MLDLTDCGIVGLAARALYSAIDSTPQEKIQTFVARFRKLKEEFDSRVGAQTLVTVAQTQATLVQTQVTVQTDSKPAKYNNRNGSQRFYFAAR